MENQIEQRLTDLKAEFESGQKVLAELEGRRAELQNTLVRISGAIQVLEELLGKEEPQPVEGADGAGSPAEVAPPGLAPVSGDEPETRD